jgi:hypothetical protein
MSAAQKPTTITGPTIPGEGPSAVPPTVGDVVDSDSSLDVNKPNALPAQMPPMVTLPGQKEVFDYDASTGLYKGRKSGKTYNPLTKTFVTEPRQ